MSENIYEGLFILDTAKYNRDPEVVSNQIAETIESMGGKVRVSRLWEERKLVYPIKGQTRGIYWLTYFLLETDKVKDLHRQFRINGNILRFLVLRIDPRLEEALVEHAIAGPVHKEEAAGLAESEEHDFVPSYDAEDEDNSESNE
ncbi:MAG: 30S ribosomal protein S6 [Thermoguttaceae bacterium]